MLYTAAAGLAYRLCVMGNDKPAFRGNVNHNASGMNQSAAKSLSLFQHLNRFYIDGAEKRRSIPML